MADLVRVRVKSPVMIFGRPVQPGVVAVPLLVAGDLIVTPRAELLDPKVDGPAVRDAVAAETRRAVRASGSRRSLTPRR